MDYIYGHHAVRAAILTKSRPLLKKLFVYYRPSVNPKLKKSEAQINQDAIMEAAKSASIPIQYSSKEELQKLSQGRPHQNVLLEASPARPLIAIHGPQCKRSLMLHAIGDPQNMGSILRTAVLMNIDNVFLAGPCCPLTPVVAKASVGALEQLLANQQIFEIKGAKEFLSSSKVPIWAATCDPSVHSDGKIDTGMLVLGNEGHGLPKSIVSCCTFTISIPMASSKVVHSFNVSVAAALLINKLFS